QPTSAEEVGFLCVPSMFDSLEVKVLFPLCRLHYPEGGRISLEQPTGGETSLNRASRSMLAGKDDFYCVSRIACLRSSSVICCHTRSVVWRRAAFSGSPRSASAKKRYAVGRSRERQCPVA